MKITEIYLSNFLSYKLQKLVLTAGCNVLEGANASGKTNFIESIYFASVGRSARQLKDKELINWDSTVGAKVRIVVEKKRLKHTIDIFIDPSGKKRIMIDDMPIFKLGELMGVLNVVYFSPDEIGLVKDSPSDRRRFLDISLSQQSKTYFYTLLKYNKLLTQRNKLLKTHKTAKELEDMIDIINQSLVQCAVYIIKARVSFVGKLTPIATQIHNKLTQNKEILELSYETDDLDFDNLSISLLKLYSDSFLKDLKLEYTTIGPHRDDLKIIASKIDIRKYGSQGQKRTAVLSLKLAEIEMYKDVTGETPILLLDDVLSELDLDRQKALFDAIKDVQTIVTCNEFDNSLATSFTKYYVKDKTITHKETHNDPT